MLFGAIVLRGLDDEQVAVQAVRKGAQDYLVKEHVDSNLLVRGIHYAVKRKRAVEEELQVSGEWFERQLE